MEPGTARIAVDLLGGDHAPAVVVDGALRPSQADPTAHLLLAAPVEAAGELLAALGPADSGISDLFGISDNEVSHERAERVEYPAERVHRRA